MTKVMLTVCLAGATFLAASNAAFSKNACERYETEINELNAKYAGQYNEIEDDAKSLSNKAQSLSDDALENLAGVDIDITMRDKRIVFDTPSVTMKNRRLVFGVPQVTMRMQSIKFDVPKTTFVLKKTGQYPEFFCEDTWIKVGPVKTKGVPKCRTVWTDIKTKVPEVRMETTEIKTKIPEFKWDDTEIVLKIPEFFMERQEWFLKIPEVKSTDLKAEQENLKNASAAVQGRADIVQKQHAAQINAITSEMYGCYISHTENEKERAIKDIDKALVDLDGVIREMVDVGIDPANVPSPDGKVDLLAMKADLVRRRQDAIDQFNAAIAQIEEEQAKALEKL